MGQRDLRTGGDLADHQRILLRGHRHRVGSRHARNHTPQGIGIRVVVQRAHEPVRRYNELLGALAGLHHEGDKPRAQRLELRHDLGRVFRKHQPLALVLGFHGTHHGAPRRIGGGGLRGDDHVVGGR